MMCGAELSKLPQGVQRVVAILQSASCTQQPRMLEDAARTAQQAADALGVELGQIAKSIIFRRKSDDAAILVITSGDKRVDELKVQALVCEDGAKLGRADADFVKLKTGFAIGGVAPVGHLTKPVTLVDKELFRFEIVWAAAGHPNAVFEITPLALQGLTSAPVADVVI
jgi:prolyl-tRNA editing enzyme YbaK/EbsC (Cys-tRNA(Pro) deacylase)